MELELAEERSRRGGAEADRERALERADSAVLAARRAAGEFAAVVEREAERASGAEERLRERVSRVVGVDLSSIAEGEEEEEDEEEESEEDEEEKGGERSRSDVDDHNEAEDREARLPPISFVV